MKENDLAKFHQHKAFQNVINEIDKLNENEHFMFNLSDENHDAYWKLLLESHDISKERYPKLHTHLTNCRTDHLKNGISKLHASFYNSEEDGFVSNNAIACLAKLQDECSAFAYSTIVDGSDSTTLILQILDADTNEVLGDTHQADVKNGRYVQIDANGNAGKRKLKAILNYAVIIEDTPYVGAVRSDSLATAANIPIVIQPASKPEHKNFKNIMIALSRGAGKAADCDYWFHKNEYSNNTIVVPFKGSTKYDSEILELLPPKTLFIDMKVIRAEGGEKKVSPSDMNEVYKWFKRTEDPKHPENGKCVLEWNMPFDGDGKTAGKAISFDKSPWAADTVTLFRCTICVKTKNSPDVFIWAFVLSHVENIADAPGVKLIKPLVFYWHCLAKGTQIRLADGTTKSIELLEGGELIQINNDGKTLPVRATTLAHFTGEALKIITTNGDQITLSKCHVVMTPGGPKSAEQLKNGDTVISLDGTTQIKSIETINFDDNLINLLLGDYEQLKTIDEYGTTMFANNILVGDHQIQTKYLEYTRSHPDSVLKRISTDWHTDFHSSIEDKKRKYH